jgi:hypothetical protein
MIAETDKAFRVKGKELMKQEEKNLSRIKCSGIVWHKREDSSRKLARYVGGWNGGIFPSHPNTPIAFSL